MRFVVGFHIAYFEFHESGRSHTIPTDSIFCLCCSGILPRRYRSRWFATHSPNRNPSGEQQDLVTFRSPFARKYSCAWTIPLAKLLSNFPVQFMPMASSAAICLSVKGLPFPGFSGYSAQTVSIRPTSDHPAKYTPQGPPSPHAFYNNPV